MGAVASAVAQPEEAKRGEVVLAPWNLSVLLRTDDLEFPRPREAFWGVGLSARPGWRQPFSGLEGDLISAGIFRVQVAFSEQIAIRFDSSVYQRLDLDREASDPEPGFDLHSDPEDAGPVRFATVLRLLPQRQARPAFGILFAAKLPTSDDEEGIGLDTTDVFASTLWDWRTRRWHLVANLGVGILTSATTLREQNDVLTWGVKTARRLGLVWSLVGEMSGRISTRGEKFPGTEDRATARLGLARAHGRFRYEAILIQGLRDIDGDLGAGFGISWVWPRRRDAPAPPEPAVGG
jgi:hypothetical protein